MAALKASCLSCIGSILMAALALPAYADGFDAVGKPLTDAQLSGWNIDISPDGAGLPPGQGTVAQGEKLYQTACVACHGAKLEGGTGPALAGGKGSLATEKPLKTIGSYWPYATTVFDYIRRAMPFQAPQSLSNDEVYAVTAYLLQQNGIIPETATMDAKTLPQVQMPNRNGFYKDDRPDTSESRCMADCVSDTHPSVKKP